MTGYFRRSLAILFAFDLALAQGLLFCPDCSAAEPLPARTAESASLAKTVASGPAPEPVDKAPSSRDERELRPLTLAQAAINQAAKNKAILTPIGRDIAEQLGVVDLINEIVDVRGRLGDDPSLGLKYVELKQKLMQSVLIASLQVRDATARIDHEIASLNRFNGMLEDQRDKAVKTNSYTNIFGTGAIQEIGQAMEMKSNEIPGEIVELVGGGLIIALGGLSLYQQRGGRRPMHAKANMLAEVLGCQTDCDTKYPAIVWNYLNRAPAGASSVKTRLQLLVEQWQAYKTIGPIKDPRSKRRLAALSNTAASGRITLDLLGDRMDMLADVKAEIFQMDRDLLELLLNVQGL